MAITPERLLQAAQVEPADLGEDIVDPELDDSVQRQAALDWIAVNVLPIADSEVSVPLLEATGYDTIAGFINERFPNVAEAVRSGWISKGAALYDGAAISYGRSELNKSINSSSKEYDADSDQDRIQGNQRLEKLIHWAAALIETAGQGTDNGGSVPVPTLGEIYSQSVGVRKRW